MSKEIEGKKSFWQSKRFWKIVGIIIAIGFVYGIGNSSAKIELEEGKVNYDELVNKIDKLDTQIENKEIELTEIEDKLSERQIEVEEAFAVIENKESIESEIGELEDTLNNKESKIKELDGQIKEKEDELASLEGEIVKAIDKPIQLTAGYYTVGEDIPAGRYKVTPVGDGSNFFVKGSTYVNTILGSFGEPEYTFSVVEGDTIQTEATVDLTPVE